MNILSLKLHIAENRAALDSFFYWIRAQWKKSFKHFTKTWSLFVKVVFTVATFFTPRCVVTFFMCSNAGGIKFSTFSSHKTITTTTCLRNNSPVWRKTIQAGGIKTRNGWILCKCLWRVVNKKFNKLNGPDVLPLFQPLPSLFLTSHGKNSVKKFMRLIFLRTWHSTV